MTTTPMTPRPARLLATLLALCLLAAPALARDHFAAPPGTVTSTEPDGSRAAPWPAVNSAFHSAGDGDRVVLLPGEYGDVELISRRFSADAPLTIVPDQPGSVHLTTLKFRRAHNVVVRDLALWPLEPDDHSRLVQTAPDTSGIQFIGLDLRGGPDAETYMNWDKADWTDRWRTVGASLKGTNDAFIDNTLTGVAFGVTTSGPGAEVRGNLIRGFSGDAMRGLGDGSVFAGNRAQDCFEVDGNHDDGFQSWARDRDASGRKVVDGMLIENNVILEWTGTPDHPLRCGLQGIGLFDGIYKDFVIRNNLIVISIWHGISVWGAQDSQIVNNTVLASDGLSKDHPWIMLRRSKGDVDPGGNTLANNIAMGFRGVEGAARANVVARHPASVLRDVAGGDFRPRAESGLIDSADPAVAPAFDIMGQPRGDRPDFGAFEAP